MEQPKTRLEQAQQELTTLQEQKRLIEHQQWELKVQDTFLKKRIKATEEEIEQLTPKGVVVLQ